MRKPVRKAPGRRTTAVPLSTAPRSDCSPAGSARPASTRLLWARLAMRSERSSIRTMATSTAPALCLSVVMTQALCRPIRTPQPASTRWLVTCRRSDAVCCSAVRGLAASPGSAGRSMSKLARAVHRRDRAPVASRNVNSGSWRAASVRAACSLPSRTASPRRCNVSSPRRTARSSVRVRCCSRRDEAWIGRSSVGSRSGPLRGLVVIYL